MPKSSWQWPTFKGKN